jgi:hypothetical protein
MDIGATADDERDRLGDIEDDGKSTGTDDNTEGKKDRNIVVPLQNVGEWISYQPRKDHNHHYHTNDLQNKKRGILHLG